MDQNFNEDFNWSRSFSDRVRGMKDTALGLVWKKRREQKLQEIEARKICRWLHSAGFPQYVQLFQDRCCPINLVQVKDDHQFFDAPSMQLLLGQIMVLNHLASQKITVNFHTEDFVDSEEDDFALSDQWMYELVSRKWMHKNHHPALDNLSNLVSEQKMHSSCSSCDSAFLGSPSKHFPVVIIKPVFEGSKNEETLLSSSKNRSKSLNCKGQKRSSFPFQSRSRAVTSRSTSVSDSEPSNDSSQLSSSWTGEDGMKSRSFLNIFRRSDGHKARKMLHRGRPPSGGGGRLEISPPVMVSTPELIQKMDQLQCVDINSTFVNQAYKTVDAESNINSAFVDEMPRTVVADCNVPLDGKILNLNNDISATGRNCYSSELRLRTHSDSFVEHFQSVKDLNHCSFECVNSFMPNVSNSPIPHRSLRNNFVHELGSVQVVDLDGIYRKKEEVNGHDIRRSIYDNLSVDVETENISNPQLELDLILDELYRNIDSLTETLQVVVTSYTGDTDSSSVFDDTRQLQSYIFSEVPQIQSSIFNNAPFLCPGMFKDLPQSHCCNIVEDTQPVYTRSPCSNLSSQVPVMEAELHLLSYNDDKPKIVCCWKSGVSSIANGAISEEETTMFSPSFEIDKIIPECDEKNKNMFFSNGKNKCHFPSTFRLSLEKEKMNLCWKSFRSHFRICDQRHHLSEMSATQMMAIHRLSLIKLTSAIDKYVPSIPLWSFWIQPKAVNQDLTTFNIFGRSLLDNVQKTGQPLPQCILYAMWCIHQTAVDAVGIFRKSGVRSRIQQLRNQVDADPGSIDFDILQVYDVADLVKLYFRELPDCLLTRSLSQTFISIFCNLPRELRLNAIQAAIVLLPEENRDVLQCLLLFLFDLSQFANKNQMTASNLSICFAPSLFHVYDQRQIPLPASPKRNQKLSAATCQKELMEQKAAHECLTYMILHAEDLFLVSDELWSMCCHLQLESSPVIHLFDLASQESYSSHFKSCMNDTLEDFHDGFKNWSSIESIDGIERSFKKTNHPLVLWKFSSDIDASPSDVFNRIQNERHVWDKDLIECRVVEELELNTDIFHYVLNFMAPQPPRSFCVLRSWNNLSKDMYILVTTSIDHPEANKPVDGVVGIVHSIRYLIESRGHRKSRLTYISHIDLRGYTPYWCRKVYSHLDVNLIIELRNSFKTET